MVHRPRLLLAAVVALATVQSGCGAAAAPAPLRVGALFPLQGAMASLAREELTGIEIARDLTNADGGVGGRQVALETRELSQPGDAPARVHELAASGAPLILGTYSSSLSMPASAAAAHEGVVYWEAGAVADQVTGRGLPGVFRVGATGSNLGSNSVRFAATVLSPRLGLTPATTRVAMVLEDDDYGRSVAAGAADAARAAGMPVVGRTTYNAMRPDWPRVLAEVAAAHPDVLILASYIPDGVAFRQAMLHAGLHVGALVGSTMAECGPEFGALLGQDAVGVFASDRPPGGFNPDVLGAAARADYNRFAAAWATRVGGQPTEEGLAGFTAAWALFHHVLPRAGGHDDAASLTRTAAATHLPEGSLPNGAGLDFAGSGDRLGQNLLAAAVIWQWQKPRSSVTVWPPQFATGSAAFVPLPR